MKYDNDLIAKKLRRWEKYLNSFNLPKWKDIPNFGLYMEQVIELLKQYLDYLPPELKEEQFITAPTINNYVRKKIMPEPVKKMYYREHIAYLIIILTLKQSMSIAMIEKLLPLGYSEAELELIYNHYVERHRTAVKYFTQQIRTLAGPILKHENNDENAAANTEELIINSAIICGFSHLLAEKLLMLDGKTVQDFPDE